MIQFAYEHISVQQEDLVWESSSKALTNPSLTESARICIDLAGSCYLHAHVSHGELAREIYKKHHAWTHGPDIQ